MNKLTLFFGGLIITAALVLQAAERHSMHNKEHAHRHGAHGAGHDEVNMPGLRGENASAAESEEIRVLFRNFDTISREVENLSNGIKTTTTSSDPEVLAALLSHVVGMLDRVAKKDDPKIIIQSPTLDIFFIRGDEINTNFEIIDERIVVVQTSEDPEIVTALQAHAVEVTAMVDRGMEAVHEMMMQRGERH